jgi:hypothetical protein
MLKTLVARDARQKLGGQIIIRIHDEDSRAAWTRSTAPAAKRKASATAERGLAVIGSIPRTVEMPFDRRFP